MKKIFYLFSIVVLGALVASCSLNPFPTFNDADAFVAFPNSSIKVTETVGTVAVPVHMTTLNGVATTVTYEFVNGSATQGVDFEDASGSGTVSFAAGEYEKFVNIKILPHLGVFTGDKTFSVKFKSTGDAACGASDICTVTISDTDHPLSALFGTYTATAFSQWEGNFSWEVTLSKDESDVSKIWLSDPDPYFASYGYSAKIYGIVNSDKTQIIFPSRQTHVSAYETAIVGFDAEDPYKASSDADIVANIAPDGTITFTNAWGVFWTGDGYDYVLEIDDEYYVIYDAGTTYKKQ